MQETTAAREHVIYLRKSRKDIDAERAGNGETLARHEKELLSLAGRQELAVGAIYREIVSGETISARPVMRQLLSEVESGVWAGVLVMEVERLARGATKDQGIVAEAFKLGRTRIITPAKTYDPDNEFDEEYFEFGLFMSRREYKMINHRIQRGRIASLEEGKYIASSPPYGYTRVKIADAKGYTLEIVPEEAEVVRLIYQLYTSGLPGPDGSFKRLGFYRISQHLNALHISARKNKNWSASSVREILSNPTYTGKIRWQNRKEMKKAIDGEIMVSRPKNGDCILYDGLHEAIVDETIYQLVQTIREKKEFIPIKSGSELQNPLSGIVFCKTCGNPMTRLGAGKRNTYDTLKCPSPDCGNISSPLPLVEESLLDALTDWLSGYDIDWPQVSDEKEDLPAKLHKTAVSREKARIGQLEKQLNNTYDLLEQGIYTKDIFQERNQVLRAQIEEAVLLLAKLEECDSDSDTLLNETFIPATRRLPDIYKALPVAAARNAFLKELVVKVEYLKTERSRKYAGNQANFELTIYPALPEKRCETND